MKTSNRNTDASLGQVLSSENYDPKLFSIRLTGHSLQTLVKVKVGTEGTTYPVLQYLLCRGSAFFRAAMKPEWNPAKDEIRVVDLTDDEPGIFEVYLHWLYFNKLPPVLMERPKSDGTTVQEFRGLAMCYVLGEKIVNKSFKDAILDALINALDDRTSKNKRVPGESTIDIVYEGTLPTSRGRKLLVNLWAHRIGSEWSTYLDDFPHDFVLEFAKKLWKVKTHKYSTRDPTQEKWRYHEPYAGEDDTYICEEPC